MDCELDSSDPPVARTDAGGKAPAPLAGHPARRGGEHGLREGASPGGDDSRDTRPDRATRFIETTRGILSYSELAPLLSERVTIVEAEIFKGGFAEAPLEESLILDLHRRIAGDLVPDWAGRWRDIAVIVGGLEPPQPFKVPILMRDYRRDLQARWPAAAGDEGDLLLELLAFAEGRFLTIHPFRDFNGRTIRLLLIEILRRLDLPRIQLAPQTDAGRAQYFAALEAADRFDWQPLIRVWQHRFSSVLQNP